MNPFARLILLAALVGAPLAPAAGQAEPERTVVIGVRTDARPFAWQAEDNPETYRGFLVDICFNATTRAGYHFEIVPVDATERLAVLDGAFVVKHRRLDLLCDPTTIALARLDRLAAMEPPDAVFTPILFVANGSFVRHGDYANRQPCVVGARAGGTAGGETRLACATGPVDGSPDARQVVLPERLDCARRDVAEYYVAGSVVGTTARATIERATRLGRLNLKAGQTICLAEAESHRDGVAAFCGNLYHFYFGDLDIIEARRKLLLESGRGCDLAPSERPLSYEPYALLVTSDDAAYRSKFITMVYEMFSDGSAAGLFDGYFPGHGKSDALGLLFRINSIPGLRETPGAAGTPSVKAADNLRVSQAP
jgi:hypothetical protein